MCQSGHRRRHAKARVWAKLPRTAERDEEHAGVRTPGPHAEASAMRTGGPHSGNPAHQAAELQRCANPGTYSLISVGCTHKTEESASADGEQSRKAGDWR